MMSDKILETLQEDEAQRFQTVFNQMPVGIVQCDLSGYIALVNDKFCETLGYSRDELIGSHIKDLTHPQDLANSLELFQNCAKTGAPFTIEKRYLRKNGSEIWCKNSVSLLRDADGNPLRILAIVSDITLEKQSLDALLQSEERYHALTKASDQIVLTMNADAAAQNSREFHRRWFSEINGLSPEDLKDDKYLETIHPDDREYLQKVMARALKNPAPYEVELRMRPRNSESYRFYNLRAIPVFKLDGSLNEWIATANDITEKKEAEAARRQFEQRYRALFEDAGDAIFVADTNGFYTDANESACRLLGYHSREEIIGKHITDFLSAENHTKLETVKERLLAGEQDFSEWILKRRDGSFITTEISARILPDGDWHAFVRDVTDRKQNERATAHLAAIVESSEDAIISKDLNGIITTWNKGAQKIFGYTPEEVIGKSILILIPPDRANEEPIILESIRRGESMENYETVRRRKDGTEIYISLTVSPIRDSQGNVIGASKIARDITERKETEAEMHENQAMLALTMRSSRMGTWVRDIPTDTIWWSEELEEIFGLKRGAFSGTVTGFYQYVHEDDRERIRAEIELAIAERRDYTIEFRFYHADGSTRWMEGRGQAMYSSGGEAIRLYGIGIDITDRKRIEETLRESELRFAKAFNSSPLTLTISSLKDGRLIEVNETFVQTTGYSREEAIGKTTLELGLWNKSEDREKELGIVRQTGQIRNAEFIFRTRSGKEITGLLSAERIEIGGEAFALTVIQDITERKHAEEAVRRSQKQTELVTNIAPVFIAQLDNERRFKFVNKAYAERFGSKPEDFVGREVSEVLGAKAYDSIKKYIDIVLSGKPVEFETEVEYKANFGRYFMHCSYAPEFADDGSGEVVGWVAAITDISERRKTEERLRESEARFRNMADNAPVMVWVTDASGYCTFLSKSWYQFTGQTPETGLGFGWLEATHPDDRQMTHDIFVSSNKSRQRFFVEYRLRQQDGEYRWAIDSALPRFGENGEFLGYIGSVIDITPRKLAEEKLRESQSHLKLTTEAAHVGTWQWNLKTNRIYWSPIHKQMWGFEPTPEPIDYSEWANFLHPEDLKTAESAIQNSLETKSVYDVEYRMFKQGTGEMRWIRSAGQVALSESGEVAQLLGISLDITERKQIEEQLIKTERRAAEDYQALLSRIVPLAQTFGAARDLLSIYRALCEFVRTSMPCTAFFVSFYDAENNLRLPAYVWGDDGEVDISMLPPMTLTPDGGPNSQAIFQQKTVVFNRYMDFMKERPHVIVNENGVDPMSSLVVPMSVMNRITGTLEVQTYEDNAFTHEHTIALEMVANLAAVAIENVRLLEVEADARRVAEDANRAKDEFLSVLSHELRTPLNSMFGWTRMLRAGMLDEQKTKQAVEVIERNVRLQNSLIEDLLDVSRIITGKMRIEKEETDFTSIVASAVEAARPAAEQKEVSLVFNSADVGSHILLGDDVRLQQIVNNLINNSIKFTTAGGAVILELSRKTGEDGNSIVMFTVSDTGIGIEPEFLPQIFDRFRQADSTTKRVHSGLGLGLTIVKHLTELHGGRVSASSEGLGKGASFTVELPLLHKSQPEHAEVDFAASANGHGSGISGSRILLVDDDCDSMMPLQIILENHHAEVFCASSVSEALEKLSTKEFDLIVSDIGMPGMDGYDLITALRQMEDSANRDIPAIALTAYASTQDKRRALMCGFQHHFAKPLDFEPFLEAITYLLDRAKK